VEQKPLPLPPQPHPKSTVPKISLESIPKFTVPLEDIFKLWCGVHDSMDGKAFVKLCKRSCLVDKNFSSRECHLVFNGLVPLDKQRMDFQTFQTSLSNIAAKKSLQESVVLRMVTWSQQREVQDNAEFVPSTTRVEKEVDARKMPSTTRGQKTRPMSASRSRPMSASRIEGSKSMMALDSTAQKATKTRRHSLADLKLPAKDFSRSEGSETVTKAGQQSLPTVSFGCLPFFRSDRKPAPDSAVKLQDASPQSHPSSEDDQTPGAASNEATTSGNAGVGNQVDHGQKRVWSSMPLMQVYSRRNCRRSIWGVDAPQSREGLVQSTSSPALHEDLQPASSGLHTPHRPVYSSMPLVQLVNTDS